MKRTGKEKGRQSCSEEANVLFVVLVVHTGKKQKNEKEREKKKDKAVVNN